MPLQQQHQHQPAWLLLLLSAAVLLTAFIAAVWPALHGPFMFDDFPNLAALAKVGDVATWRDLGIYLSENRGFPGRPLAMLSFLPQQGDWPGNPFPFKLVNLLLHLANAGLVFCLARVLVVRAFPALAGATALAALIASAWLIHPMQLSAVLLVVQRMTLLSTMFVLLGLLAYVRGLCSTASSVPRRAAWMSGGIVACGVLGVLCKESAVLLPVYAWVIDRTLLNAQREALPPRLKWLRRFLLWLPTLLVCAYLVYQLRDAFAPIVNREFTVAERALSQPRILWDYLGNLAFPRYGQFGLFHDDVVASKGLLSPWTTLPALIGVLGALGFALSQTRRRPLAAFAILWFIGGHALESSTIPLELYFDHRNYLPLAGPIFSAVVGLATTPSARIRGIGSLALAAWLLASLLATVLYAQVWTSSDRATYFWAEAHPSSVRAQTSYAQRLDESGLTLPARDVMAAALLRRPDDVGLDVGLALLDCRIGSLTPAQVAQLREKLSRASWSLFAYQTMGALQALAANHQCAALTPAAWTSLSDALLSNPAYLAEPGARGNLHYQRHLMAVARGDLDNALSELDETRKYEPDPEIVRLQAKYLADAGLRDEAIRRLRAYDPSTRPLLRRILVDDAAINAAAIRAIEASPPARGTTSR